MTAPSHTTLSIELDGQPSRHPIVIGKGLLAHCAELIETHLCNQGPPPKRLLLVTDQTVAPLYGTAMQAQLEAHGCQVASVILPGGETNKTLAGMAALFEAAEAFEFKRNDAVIALGGGIIGDMAGFFAASILRGVRLIQVPTSLLAQVDSSVGGKTGVNHHRLKNWIGAFYQPHLVIIDPDTITSLPEREIGCGLAEIAKYGFIQDSIGTETKINVLETVSTPSFRQALNIDWVSLIASCCQLKAAVVQADAKETSGHRALLNFGHTFGHAYETLLNHRLNHGEAVAIGMADALFVAAQLGRIDPSLAEKGIDLLRQLDLPTTPPEPIDTGSMVAAMGQDKKNRSGQAITLVLPVKSLGRVQLADPIEKARLMALLDQRRLN
ncbi:MAG: 3-dehydroquinate synthase, partial [Cyanobacteria bacterium HKST-UBA06]|nr:3-dehydroquinate synthase [Cyanobacteria bacterium HKST-UBA06]